MATFFQSAAALSLAACAGVGPLAAQPAYPNLATGAGSGAAVTTISQQEVDQRAIHLALMLTGYLDGLIDLARPGEVAAAIGAWQAAHGYRRTGALTMEQSSELLTESRALQRAIKFKTITDPLSGITIGVPTALVTEVTPTGWGSVLHGQVNGTVVIGLAAIAPSAMTLSALHEQALAIGGDRGVTKMQMRDAKRSIVLRKIGGDRVYSMFVDTPLGLRGFTVRYTEADWRVMHRVVVAMANTFVPLAQPAAVLKPAPAPRQQQRLMDALLPS